MDCDNADIGSDNKYDMIYTNCDFDNAYLCEGKGKLWASSRCPGALGVPTKPLEHTKKRLKHHWDEFVQSWSFEK